MSKEQLVITFKSDIKKRRKYFVPESFSHPLFFITGCDKMTVWKSSIKLTFHPVLFVVDLKRSVPKPVASVLVREEEQSHAEIMLSRYVNSVRLNSLFPYGVSDKAEELFAQRNVKTNTLLRLLVDSQLDGEAEQLDIDEG